MASRPRYMVWWSDTDPGKRRSAESRWRCQCDTKHPAVKRDLDPDWVLEVESYFLDRDRGVLIGDGEGKATTEV